MQRNGLIKYGVMGLALAGMGVSSPAMADEEGDGFPHIAIAEEAGGELAVEFEIDTGLDLGTTPPTITLVAPSFSAFFGGYQTFPLTPTAFAAPTVRSPRR